MRKYMRQIRKQPWTAFYLLSALGILMYLILSMKYGSALYTWLLQENEDAIRFSDYFWHLSVTVDRHHLYENISWEAAGCFPPLAYCMYTFLYKLTRPLDMVPQSMEEAEAVPGALPIFTYYLIFTALLFFLGISINGRRSRKRDAGIFTLLMLSAIFLGSAFHSGNSVVLVLTMLLWGLRLRDSESRWKRETGTLLISVCVALKLYPAVFGLLYLKEKRYAELARLILYSALLLFVPFVFFGGYVGFRHWLLHILTTMKYSDFYRLEYFQGMFYTLIRRLTGRETTSAPMILSLITCLILAWNAWQSRSKSRTLFFLITIMAFFPANAYRYTLCYFAIPLIRTLKEEPDSYGRPDSYQGMCTWPISILYGLLFTVPTWWLLVIPMEKRYPYPTLTAMDIYLYLMVYLLLGVTLLTEWWDRFRIFRTQKRASIDGREALL